MIKMVGNDSNKKGICRALFSDVPKAFHYILHDLLIVKLIAF